MLFLAGGDDTVVPADEVRAVASPYPRAEVMVVPQAGHLRTMLMDQDLYTGVVLEFLARTVGASRPRATRPGSRSRRTESTTESGFDHRTTRASSAMYHEPRSAGKPGRQHPFVGGVDVGQPVLVQAGRQPPDGRE